MSRLQNLVEMSCGIHSCRRKKLPIIRLNNIIACFISQLCDFSWSDWRQKSVKIASYVKLHKLESLWFEFK